MRHVRDNIQRYLMVSVVFVMRSRILLVLCLRHVMYEECVKLDWVYMLFI